MAELVGADNLNITIITIIIAIIIIIIAIIITVIIQSAEEHQRGVTF